MIGMISPVFPARRRVLACRCHFSELTLYFSTEACIDRGADVCAYPRSASVYTIRTPSPDGQHGAFLPSLPVSLSGMRNCGIVLARQSRQTSAPPKKQKNNLRGFRACRSKQLHLSWCQVSPLRPVAIQSVSKPSGALPSVPVRRSSQTTGSLRGRHLARAQMCSFASLAPVSVTRPDTHTQAPLRQPRKSRLRGSLGCLGLIQKYPSCYRKTSHVQ